MKQSREDAESQGCFYWSRSSLRLSHGVCHHLLVKSLKQRRSLLWWRNSFGSSGMSERKTCATSRGPCVWEGNCYLRAKECLSLLNTDPDVQAHSWGICSSFRFYIISFMYLNRHLVDSGAHTALQDHLQHLGVCRVLVCGKGQLLGLLLHVLDGHLHGDKNDLQNQRQSLWRPEPDRSIRHHEPFSHILVSECMFAVLNSFILQNKQKKMLR